MINLRGYMKIIDKFFLLSFMLFISPLISAQQTAQHPVPQITQQITSQAPATDQSIDKVKQAQLAMDRYVIDPEHTFSSFEYKHWGLSLQRNRFDRSSGVIDLNLSEKKGSIRIDIEASSVSTGVSAFDSLLRSDSFFDVQKFPKITFESNKFIFEKDQLKQLEGQLSIKGITRPVTIEVTYFSCKFMFIYLKSACGANGKATILRSDFNVGRYVPFVSDEITLYFSVEAIKE
jgi:polyisoprenoid-binding protein YceI